MNQPMPAFIHNYSVLRFIIIFPYLTSFLMLTLAPRNHARQEAPASSIGLCPPRRHFCCDSSALLMSPERTPPSLGRGRDQDFLSVPGSAGITIKYRVKVVSLSPTLVVRHGCCRCSHLLCAFCVCVCVLGKPWWYIDFIP